MAVLIACEESQAVTIEFRNLGVEAYSCDLEPCSGGHPEWHLRRDVSELFVVDWKMIIAFPPCTHLAVFGARYFAQKRLDGRQPEAVSFFLQFTATDCPFVAIENPIGIMSSIYRKPDQIIQPWMFGHPESKSTCLWLRGLPKLEPTEILTRPNSGYWENQTPSGQNKLSPSPERAKLRSKTYAGIARAMAEQWSKLL